MAGDESQKQKWGDCRTKEWRQKSAFCVIDGALSSQRQSRTSRRHCERWFRIICSIHWTRIISITNDGSKNHGYYIKASRMFRTGSWSSIRIYSGQKGRCINFAKFPKSECPDTWIRLPPQHRWPKSWSTMEDPVVPLERNLYGHLLAGLLWERQIEKVLLEHVWKRFWIVNVFFLATEQEDFLSVYVDGIKMAGMTENIETTWKILMKDVDLGVVHIISWPRIFRLHSKRVSNLR